MSSYQQQIAIIDQSAKQAARQFRHVIPKESDLKWATEKVFALDIMRKSADLRAAIPETQVSALLQAGSMGLTLNPNAGECYLIPRRMKRNDPNSSIIAYASPSYRGLIKTAVDSGAILYGVAEVVYMNDRFEWFGKTKPPIHEVDVKKPRGEPVGAYALAKLPSGDVIPEWMSREEIEKVKGKSDNPGGLMWTEFWTQGWCKAVLRRAQKTWPRSPQLNAAIEVLNEHEGIDLSGAGSPAIDADSVKLITEDQSLTIHAKITDSFENSDEMMKIFLNWLKSYYGIDSIDELPAEHYQAVIDKITESIKHKQAEAEASD